VVGLLEDVVETREEGEQKNVEQHEIDAEHGNDWLGPKEFGRQNDALLQPPPKGGRLGMLRNVALVASDTAEVCGFPVQQKGKVCLGKEAKGDEKSSSRND
jgi:hypothetical protein